METQWHCGCCKVQGEMIFAPGTPFMQMFEHILMRHDKVSRECKKPQLLAGPLPIPKMEPPQT